MYEVVTHGLETKPDIEPKQATMQPQTSWEQLISNPERKLNFYIESLGPSNLVMIGISYGLQKSLRLSREN